MAVYLDTSLRVGPVGRGVERVDARSQEPAVQAEVLGGARAAVRGRHGREREGDGEPAAVRAGEGEGERAGGKRLRVAPHHGQIDALVRLVRHPVEREQNPQLRRRE